MSSLECYKQIRGWFNYDDLYAWQVSIHGDGAQFVEVGSWLGKSTCYMASAIASSGKRIHFYAVDVWDVHAVHSFYALDHQSSLYSFLEDGVFIEFLDNLKRCGVAEYVV